GGRQDQVTEGGTAVAGLHSRRAARRETAWTTGDGERYLIAVIPCQDVVVQVAHLHDDGRADGAAGHRGDRLHAEGKVIGAARFDGEAAGIRAGQVPGGAFSKRVVSRGIEYDVGEGRDTCVGGHGGHAAGGEAARPAGDRERDLVAAVACHEVAVRVENLDL